MDHTQKERKQVSNHEYVGLHVHTEMGSLMDGVATAEEYAARAAAIGMPALAVTDHGSLSAHRRFHRATTDVGVKPILGIEAYVCEDVTDKRDRKERVDPLDRVYFHLTILAKNDVGLENLSRLNEAGWNEGYYFKPRMDLQMLLKYKEGLIIGSACMGGLINSAIEVGEYATAKRHLQWFKDNFGDDFYVEVMPHNIPGMNTKLIELADEFGIKIIVTPDCHHATVDQKVIQEIMLINNTHAKVVQGSTYDGSRKIKDPMKRLDYLYGEDRKMSFNNFDIHLLSGDEMWEAMGDDAREDMFENTLVIADSVEPYTIQHDLNLLPVTFRNADKELRDSATKFLKDNGLDTPEYMSRLEEELKVIKEKKFANYFIIVRNMINWAKSQDILVGPGRGSAAGSLLCYALGITAIDPIKYGLLFFRFIDMDRADWPDIDTDIQDSRREEVKQYLVEQYKFVASIATFLQFKGKGIVRDVARCFNVPLADVNRVLKTVNDWEEFTDSKDAEWFREKYPEVVEYGEQLRGRTRGTGIHAAGIVTSKTPISKVAPMETRAVTGGDGVRIPVIAVDMDEAADIGLIKLDALGLSTLTIIDDTLKEIKQRHHKDINLAEIPLDDKNVYHMLSDGRTKGVFQCSAAPYTSLIVKMGLNTFDELVASNALVRPGAMNTIGKEYVARKNRRQMIAYPSPILKEFTSDTYGCILYQEQVMLACVRLGGMTMGEANKVRKIIGKKKDAALLEPFRVKFVENATDVIGGPAAEKMWHDFEAHAGYSFNKSHAVAYSTISYWTAWLKYYYPLEFMVCLLRKEKDTDIRTEYLIEAKRMGIPIKLPHINDSAEEFTIEGKGIRIGLSSIKFLSKSTSERYIAARPFKSYAEVEEFTFTKGSGVNSRALASMKAIGALTFPDNPANVAEIRANSYEYLNLPEFNDKVPVHYPAFLTSAEDYDEKGAYIVMGVARDIKRGTGWSRVSILEATGVIGVFDREDSEIETGRTYLFLIGSNSILEAVPVDDIDKSKSPLVRFLNYKTLPYGDDEVFVVAFSKRTTKAGKRMGTLVVADSGRDLYSMVVFPSQFSQAYMKIEAGNAYKINYSESKEGDLVFQGVIQ